MFVRCVNGNILLMLPAYSCHLLFLDRRGWRRANIQGKVDLQLFTRDRHFLCVGLLLAMAQISRIRCFNSFRSIRWIVHYVVYCCQYIVHGLGSSWHGQRYGESTQKWKLCKYCIKNKCFVNLRVDNFFFDKC